MTIDNVQDLGSSVQYIAALGQTVFPVPFPFVNSTDIKVQVGIVTLANGTDYNVSGAGNDLGGSLTLTIGALANSVYTVSRDMAIARATQYQQNGPFTSAAINAELNNLVLIDQQLEDKIGFAISVPNTNIGGPVTTLLPGLYKNGVLGFDANGNPTPLSIAMLTTQAASLHTLPLPTDTGMHNGAPYFMGAQLGSAVTPTTIALPLVTFTKYINATTGLGSGYDGGAGWFQTFVEGGTGFGKGVTGFVQVDASNLAGVAVHGFGVAGAAVSGAQIFSGWFTSHDNAATAVNICTGVEIDLVLSATRARVTGVVNPANAAIGLWVNNQSDEVGNFHGTCAVGITGETNSGGLGFTSQWHTGLFFQQNSIVPGGVNEAIQINGASLAANRYTGMRLIGNFDVGIDLSGGIYTGTGAAILLGNTHIIYAIDGSAVGQPVFYMSAGSALILGQGATGGVEFNTTKIGFGTTPVSLVTGYGTPTGGGHQASFAAGAITLGNLAAAVAQLINDLKAYGLLLA